MNKFLLSAIFGIFGIASSLRAQTVPSYVPVSGLVGWYPFNGNANDESGHGNNGIPSGVTLTSDRFGNANKAYSFNTSYIMIPSSSSFNFSNLSVSAWINANTLGVLNIAKQVTYSNATNELFSLSIANSTGDIKMYAKYNVPGCGPGVGWQELTSTQKVTTGTFHHIVSTVQGNLISIYIDGSLNGTLTVSGSQISPCFGGDIQIGRDWVSYPHYFDGKIDDIGIWNRALTPSEVTALFTAPNVGINEVSTISLFSLSPNPASSHINIKADAKLIGSSYTVYDNIGKVVLNGRLTKENMGIDVSNLSHGIYYFNIEGSRNQKFQVTGL